jgi:hypothetical protein
MVFLVVVLAALGWVFGKAYRYYVKVHRKGMIEIPNELSDEFLLKDPNAMNDNDEEDQLNHKKRNRYSKSQARLRMKKGKS